MLLQLLGSEVFLLLLEQVIDQLLLVSFLQLLIALHVLVLVHLGDASPQTSARPHARELAPRLYQSIQVSQRVRFGWTRLLTSEPSEVDLISFSWIL